MIEKDIFKEAIADSKNVIKNLKADKNLYSIFQIIERGKTDTKLLDRCFFKLREFEK